MKHYELLANLHRITVDMLINDLAKALAENEQLKAELAQTKEVKPKTVSE